MILHLSIESTKEILERIEDGRIHVKIDMPELELLRDLVEEIHTALCHTRNGREDKINLNRFEELQEKLDIMVPRDK